MNEQEIGGIHRSFWVIGVVALIWNVMGCVNFFAQMNPEVLANYRESERMIISGRPVWATCAFALAVFCGALGSLLLLLRNAIAYHLFVASLLGVIVTMGHTLGIGIDFGLGEMFGIIMMPVGVAIFLAWYSSWARHKGWLDREQ